MNYLLNNFDTVLALTGEHLTMIGIALLISIVIALPLGVLLVRVPRLATFIVGLLGILYTIPSIALLILLLPIFGLNQRTVIAALVIYTQIILVRNTITGLQGVPAVMLEAARGMGMNGWQRWWRVQFPLALPVILAGVRIATVVAIGIATIGAKFSAGGLGVLLFEGIAQNRYDKIVGGSLVIALLALVLNRLLLTTEAYFDTDQRIRRIERRQQRSASAMTQVTS